MGTAPDERQSPAMPDPTRTVARTITITRRLGIPDAVALHLIITGVREVQQKLALAGHGDETWTADLIEAARARLTAPVPSITDHSGDDNGDGTSGARRRPA